MKYYVKNKLVSFGDGSYVINEEGKNIYEVKGKIFSPTHKKKIFDMNGNLLYIVRNKFWKFIRKSAYVYNHDKSCFGRIKERFFGGYDMLNCKENITFERETFKGIYVFKDGEKIGFFHLQNSFEAVFVRDAYELEVLNEEYTSLLIAIVLAYDNIRDQRKEDVRRS